MNFLFVSMNLFPQIKALVFAESALLSVVIIWSGIKKVIVVRYALSPLKRRLERFLFAGWINFIFFILPCAALRKSITDVTSTASSAQAPLRHTEGSA